MNPIPSEPVRLIEDAETGDRLLVYATEKGIRVELKYEGDTLWMTQRQMSDLFGVNIPTISRHLKNIFEDNELSDESVVSKNEITASDGKRYTTLHYNLDAIISVAYRVNSSQGTQLRKWATEKLVQFATKGFVIDSERLKNPDANDRISELREIIRDIRADEANVYRELRKICSMCSDYDPKLSTAHEFYTHMQAKLMWAVTTHTPSEMVKSRANADHENMGLRTWRGEDIRQSDVIISKNYLAEIELKELNRLTTILLDVFEDQLDAGKITTMVETESLLDGQLKFLNRAVLNHGGSVSALDAKAHAQEQYRKYNEKRRSLRHVQADKAIADLRKQEKQLKKRKSDKSR